MRTPPEWPAATSAFPEPDLVDTVEATYTERQLDQTRSALEAAFDELAATRPCMHCT